MNVENKVEEEPEIKDEDDEQESVQETEPIVNDNQTKPLNAQDSL